MQVLALVLTCACLQGGTQPPPKQAPKPPPPTPKVAITDIAVGTGDAAIAGDEVTVDYTGKLSSGKVFDTSKKPGRGPYTFFLGLSQVIAGWDQGLVGMKSGGTRKLVIPGSLAYGAQGAPPEIPSNATLVFTIAMRKIVPMSSAKHPAKKLKIQISNPGDGPAVKFGDVGFVKMTGKTADGTVFISTGEDLPFGARIELGKTPVPPGFTFGILGMKKGEKRTVVVPPELGFGAVGDAEHHVKPNDILTLECELMSIGGPKPPTGPTRSKDGRE
jgi:FKBP-type peptidyl-prolyl cis-trans isomerase